MKVARYSLICAAIMGACAVFRSLLDGTIDLGFILGCVLLGAVIGAIIGGALDDFISRL